MSLVSYSLSLANSPRKLEAYNKVIGMLIADGSEGLKQTKFTLTLKFELWYRTCSLILVFKTEREST